MLDLIRKAIELRLPGALRLRLLRWIGGSIVREFPFGLGVAGLVGLAALARRRAFRGPLGIALAVPLAFAEVALGRLGVQSLRSAAGVREQLAELQPPEDEARSGFPRRELVLPPLMLWPRGVRHARGVEYARDGEWPLLLDVYLPDEPPSRASAPGDRPGPRRRLDRRQSLRAGHPAAQPPRPPRLGRLQHRLPAEPARDLPRPRRRRQARDRLGARARRGATASTPTSSASPAARPAATSPRSPRSPPGDPALQPGFEDADTSVAAAVPFYGVYDLADAESIYYPELLDWVLERLVFKARRRGRPRALPRRLADPSRARRRAAVPRHPRRARHAGPGRRRAAVRRASCARSPTSPVLYAELAGAEHAFDLGPSLRTARVVEAIERFLATVRADRPAAAPAQVIG